MNKSEDSGVFGFCVSGADIRKTEISFYKPSGWVILTGWEFQVSLKWNNGEKKRD